MNAVMEQVEKAKARVEELEKFHHDNFSLEHGLPNAKELWAEVYKLTEFIRKNMVARPDNTDVGDGVTVHLYTDAHAYTVIAKTAHTITIQRDDAKQDGTWKRDFEPGGFCGHTYNQEEQCKHWIYTQNKAGEIRKVYAGKDGVYRKDGKALGTGRHEFYDYNF